MPYGMTWDDMKPNGYSGASSASQMHACNCIGPQKGQPLCPCAMRGVIERDGRYIQPERDLGPVPKISGTL